MPSRPDERNPNNMNANKHNSREYRKSMMLTQPVGSVILRMACPCIISFLITSIYNLADTFFVSSLGTNATAAVSVNASLDQFITMVGTLLGVGANSYSARLLGAKKEEQASSVVSTAFYLALAFGVVFLVAGGIFITPMVRLLGATPTCEQYSIEYATFVVLVAPFMSASFVQNQCLRAEGSAMFSMFGMGFGGLLNCVLDPIFITGMGLGVKGASIATAISKFVSFCILMYPYAARRSLLRISLSRVKICRDTMREIVSVGSSSMFRAGLNVVAAIVLNNIAGGISDSALAAIGVSTKVMMFPFGFVLGFGTGYQPVAGYNWGARRYDRVRECYRFASRTALAGSAAMGLLLALLAEPIIALFTKSDVSMMTLGAWCIRLQCFTLPAHAWVVVVNMLCAGLGYGKYALLLSTARQGTCFLPIVYPASRFFGAAGLISVQAAADVLTLFITFPVARYMLKILKDKEAEQALVPAVGNGVA